MRLRRRRCRPIATGRARRRRRPSDHPRGRRRRLGGRSLFEPVHFRLQGRVLSPKVAVLLPDLIEIVAHHLHLAVHLGEAVVEIAQTIGQGVDLALGFGRLNDHGRPGLAPLIDDGAQLAHHLLEIVEPPGRMLVQAIVDRRLRQGRDADDQKQQQGGAGRARGSNAHGAPDVIAVWALRLWAWASAPPAVSIGRSLP
jgi:hypothetical protein